jgi:hypothetical protein
MRGSGGGSRGPGAVQGIRIPNILAQAVLFVRLWAPKEGVFRCWRGGEFSLGLAAKAGCAGAFARPAKAGPPKREGGKSSGFFTGGGGAARAKRSIFAYEYIIKNFF